MGSPRESGGTLLNEDPPDAGENVISPIAGFSSLRFLLVSRMAV